MSAPELQWMSSPLENGAGATVWPEFVGRLLCYIRLMISVFVYLSSCNERLFHLKVGLMPDFNPNLPPCLNCPMYLQEGQPYTFITQLVGQANFPFVSLLYLNLFTFVFWFLYWQKLWPNIQINHPMHTQIDGSSRKLRGQEGGQDFLISQASSTEVIEMIIEDL